jgi:hypothetical protein
MSPEQPVSGVRFEPMTVPGKLRLRRVTAQQRADRAELKAFHGGVVGSDAPKNRKSQLLLVLGLAATFFGSWLAVVGVFLGFALLALGLPVTVATAVWCIRNWEY